MHKISRQLIDSILDDPDVNEAYGKIGGYIWPRSGGPDLGLSRPELNYYLFATYDAEVGRNGHVWFFLNPAGDDASRILAAMNEMGLTRPYEILTEACSVFPGSRVPTSQDERIEVIQTLPFAETRALWDRLDQEFDQYEALYVIVMVYLRKHRSDVLRPETD